MANYAQLKSAVNAVITTNGNNEITGAILNNILNTIIDTIGGNYTFAGVATPSTSVGSPDPNVFWIGGAGTYTNFGSTITITEGNIGIFTYNGTFGRFEVETGAGNAVKYVEQTLTNAQQAIAQENIGSPVREYKGTITTSYAWLQKVDIPAGCTFRNLSSTRINLYQTYGDANSTHTVLEGNETKTISHSVGGIRSIAVISNYDIIVYIDAINGIPAIPLIGYYECDTNASTYQKVISAPNYSLQTGGMLKVKMLYKHTSAQQPTLNINSTGQKQLYYNGNQSSNVNTWEDGEIVVVFYDGVQYQSYPVAEKFGMNITSAESIRAVDVLYGLFESTNLYDKNDPNKETGVYVDYTRGVLSPSASYNASGWIPIIGGQYYIGKSGATQTAFYDKNLKYISGVSSLSATGGTQAPANAVYMRVSVSAAQDDVMCIVQGTTTPDYTPFKLFLKNVYGVNVDYGDVSNVNVTPQQASFFERNESTNLVNPQTLTDNYYVAAATGRLTGNNSYAATDYIPVEGGAYYIGYGMGQTAFYNESKEFISGVATIANTVAQAPSNAAYMRSSLRKDAIYNNEQRINKSQTLLPYEPYYDYYTIQSQYIPNDISINRYETLLGQDGISASLASISTGESIVLTSFPRTIKHGNRISFDCLLTSFGDGFSIGKGNDMYGSQFWEITATEIKQYTRDSANVLRDTQSHGLTFESYIKVLIIQNDSQTLFVLSTLSGTYTHTYSYGYTCVGAPFILSNGAYLTNAKLCATNQYLKSTMWAFGDSYFGIDGSSREYYWLKQWGAANYLVAGYAGAGSSTMYPDLLRCLAISQPKYIIWALGMNDTNGANNISGWQTYIDSIIQKCEQLGITPIFVTIPTPLSTNYKNKEAMTTYLLSTGKRVINAASAVGSQSNGHWYGYGTAYDYQSTDNVHTSEYGARAIAEQFCVDAPEIMQY